MVAAISSFTSLLAPATEVHEPLAPATEVHEPLARRTPAQRRMKLPSRSSRNVCWISSGVFMTNGP